MLKVDFKIPSAIFTIFLAFIIPVVGFAGPDQAKLSSYFDSLVREDAAGFEGWYPKTKDKIDNPRAFAFDAALALGASWPSGVATAIVASYNSAKPYAEAVETWRHPQAVLATLRNCKAVVTSELIDQGNPDNSKFRLSLSMPFLEDLNGFYSFRFVPISDKRSVVRITQLSSEGPQQDTEKLLIMDRNENRTTFYHVIDVVVLKREFKNSFIGNLWFRYKTRKNLMSILEAFGGPTKSGSD
jgi:hypothetical protein